LSELELLVYATEHQESESSKQLKIEADPRPTQDGCVKASLLVTLFPNTPKDLPKKTLKSPKKQDLPSYVMLWHA
jgi:hypothetical protein